MKNTHSTKTCWVAAAAALACTPLASAQSSGSNSGSGSGIYWNVTNESPVDLVLAHNEQGSIAANLDARTTVDALLGTLLDHLRKTGQGPGGGGGGGGGVAVGGGGAGIVGFGGSANIIDLKNIIGGGHGDMGGDSRRSTIDLANAQAGVAASTHPSTENVPAPGGSLVIAVAALSVARRRTRGI